MKKNVFLLGIAALLAANSMTSCSSDELESQRVQNAAQKISFTYNGGAGTRATSDPQAGTSVATGLNVGIFGVSSEEETTMTNYINNNYVTAAGNAISIASGGADMTWPTASGATASIYAYAPYNDTWTLDGAMTFSVKADQSAEADYLASDLLYASAASQATGSTVNLAFSHKLSKMNVTISKTSDSNIDLTNATVTITNTKTATTLNLTSGAIGEASGTATDIVAVTSLGESTTACAVIVPQTVSAGTELVKIEADGKTLIAKLGGNTTFESGNVYNFTVSVGKVDETSPVTTTTLVLGSTSVVQWTDNDLGSYSFPKAYATFGTPGSNATYSSETSTYGWSATNNNLMTCFEFSNGELVNYKTLVFKISSLSGGMVRMGYYIGSTYTEFGSGFGSSGTKYVDLTTLGIDLSTVTKISFGGRSLTDSSVPGSVVINPSEVYLSTEVETAN